MSKNWLFIHIMKTAGTSFRQFVSESFPNDYYPNKSELQRNPVSGHYLNSREFIERMNRSGRMPNRRFYFGHYPYSIVEKLAPDFKTASILREPFARSLSMIHHRRRSNPEKYKQMSDLDVLHSDHLLGYQIRNYQTKVLAMPPVGHMEVNWGNVDENGLLERATTNLEALSFLGITERMGEALTYWRTLEPGFERDFPFANASPKPLKMSGDLKSALSENLQLDMQLYKIANSIVDRQSGIAQKTVR